MQVVILAGGKGTRLYPLTYDMPKPMVLVKGKPFLEYLLEVIKSNGLKKIIFLVGYLGDKIEEYFGNGAAIGFNIEYSYEKNLLGTAGALKNAENKLEDEFLLINGDTLLPINYQELIKYFHASWKTAVMAAYKGTAGGKNNIFMGERNIVLGYNKSNSEGMTHIDAGVLIFKKEILDIIPEGIFCSLEKEIFAKLIEKKELLAYPTDKKFYDMGSFKGLEDIKEVLK